MANLDDFLAPAALHPGPVMRDDAVAKRPKALAVAGARPAKPARRRKAAAPTTKDATP